MCAIGRALGKRMRALITRMDQPLGRAVGNAVEVAECVECLRNAGPTDLTDLSVELAAEMVVMGERAKSLESARELCRQALSDGSALERFGRLVAAQGGDPRVVDDPGRLPQPRRRHDLIAPRGGIVQALAARAIGQATMLLGAGRARVDSAIDPAVGVLLHKKVGDAVAAGEPLCTLLVNDETHFEPAFAMINGAFVIGHAPVVVPELIVERLG
jgi:pyrimidine-nucleoside phosphorylase/thymidine phosphorylase